MTIVFQSLQQIKNLYPDTWGLFMGGAVLGFRPADLETAEWLSKRSGEMFVPSPSFADPSNPTDLGVRPSWGPQKRERIPVGKMFGMPQGRALVWLPSDEAPRMSWVKGYFDIPELAARADPNPYYTGRASRTARPRKWVRVAGVLLAAGVGLWPSAVPSDDRAGGVAVKPAGVVRHDAVAPQRGTRAATLRVAPAK